MFDSVVIKLGHDAYLRHCLDAVVSGERSRAIMAVFFLYIAVIGKEKQTTFYELYCVFYLSILFLKNVKYLEARICYFKYDQTMVDFFCTSQ
jgi:hypothetical protein